MNIPKSMRQGSSPERQATWDLGGTIYEIGEIEASIPRLVGDCSAQARDLEEIVLVTEQVKGPPPETSLGRASCRVLVRASARQEVLSPAAPSRCDSTTS